MVCETKIVADEHDAIHGTKKESILWSSPPSSTPLNPAEAKDVRKDVVFIREFERGDQKEVRRIFYEGIMERIPNTAFRGLWQQPKTQFLYVLLTSKYPHTSVCRAAYVCFRPTFFLVIRISKTSNVTSNMDSCAQVNVAVARFLLGLLPEAIPLRNLPSKSCRNLMLLCCRGSVGDVQLS